MANHNLSGNMYKVAVDPILTFQNPFLFHTSTIRHVREEKPFFNAFVITT